VPEATDATEQLFGTDRMVAALQAAEEGTPDEILAAVDRAVQDFVGDAPQFDDLTMLCIHLKALTKRDKDSGEIGQNRKE
jgi:sigma-B regulation protein RsbU (phosphoserine phosphatase)